MKNVHVTDSALEPRKTQKPTAYADVLRSNVHFWHESEFDFEPLESIVAENTSYQWASVRLGDTLSEKILAKQLVTSGEPIRELLLQQLGSVMGHPSGFDEVREELNAIRKLVDAANSKIEEVVERQVQVVCVPLRSFVPDALEVVVPIDVVLSSDADGFQAAFLDANLHAYGETKEEAWSNLRATIQETYERLRKLPDDQLGRSMRRQKRVLNYHLRDGQG